MRRILCLALFLGCVGLGCRERNASSPAAGPGTGAPAAASRRSIDIRVSNLGYAPNRLIGKPGEAVVLIFHYDPSAGECGREVLLPDKTRVPLSADKAVPVPLSFPARGELTFTCGMGMLRGTLVVE